MPDHTCSLAYPARRSVARESRTRAASLNREIVRYCVVPELAGDMLCQYVGT